MSVHKKILITRPVPEAQEDAAELQKRGFSTLCAPMLEIRPVAFDRPDLDAYQALVFTSAQAVRLFPVPPQHKDIQVFCVGDKTAQSAREKSFTNVTSAQGTAADLKTLLDGQKHALHICGRDVARTDLGLETLVVYEAVFTNTLTPDVVEALRNKDIGAVMFFSGRTAENFLRLAHKENVTQGLQSVTALCITSKVLEDVRPGLWERALAARTADRRSMLALLEDLSMGTSNAMTASEEEAIENATEIIERFGGIRPMAKKMDIAVTTVQGWKKRDVIPAARRQQVLEAAANYDVDLSDMFGHMEAANQNETIPQKQENPERQNAGDGGQPEKNHEHHEEEEKLTNNAPPKPQTDHQALDRKLAATEKRAVTKSVWIAVTLVIIGLGAVIALFWPEKERLDTLEGRMGSVQGDVEALRERQSFFGMLLPENLEEQLSALREQAGKTQEQIGQVLSKAQDISNDVFGENAGNANQRLAKLEKHVSDLAGVPVLSGFLEHIDGLRTAPGGTVQLKQVMNDLGALVGNMSGPAAGENSAFETKLDEARQKDPAIGQTFGNVPVEDLKAAALLLGMTQFRSALNRDGEAFDSDLKVLEGLIGEDNVELRASLERLAPQAKEGVLTPRGLTDEFRSLAGDAVVASLSGEDVSLKERASARFNDVFQVEKDGELITGTPTQATLAETEKLLEDGKLEDAIATAENLDGPAAQVMAPWLDQAHATLLAQKVKTMLGDAINLKAYGGGKPGITAGGVLPGTSRLIRDEKSGITVLKPAMPPPPKLQNANPFD